MRNTKLILAATVALYFSFFISGCDDPENVNPPELITTFTMTCTPQGGGTAVIFQFSDLDGDGGNPPVITNGVLDAGAVYNVTLELLNEAVNPVENITEEVEEEGEDHQFFFQPQAGLNLTFAYADTDAGGHPVGLVSTATCGAASAGTLIVTLRHEPDKHATGVEDGDITNAGGDTDLEVAFNVVIQ